MPEHNNFAEQAKEQLHLALKKNHRLYTDILEDRPTDSITSRYVASLALMLQNNEHNLQQKLIDEYIKETQRASAIKLYEKIFDQKAGEENVLIKPLIDQIKLAENLPNYIYIDQSFLCAFNGEIASFGGEYESREYMFFSEHEKAYNEEIQNIIQQYQQSLITQNQMPDYIKPLNITINNNDTFKKLLNESNETYSKYIFAKAQKLIPSTEEAQIARSSKIEKLLCDSKNKKDLALKKLMFFCYIDNRNTVYRSNYSNNVQSKITTILNNFENNVTSNNIQEWATEANNLFYNIPGCYMFSEEKRQELTNKLFIFTALNALEVEEYDVNMFLQNVFLPDVKESHKKAASETYKDVPENAMHPLIDWKTGTPDLVRQRFSYAREEAKKIFNQIPGNALLEAQDRSYFINMFTILKENENIQQQEEPILKQLLFPYKEEEIEQYQQEIHQKIHNNIANSKQANDMLQEINKAHTPEVIPSLGLQRLIQKQLTEVIVNTIKQQNTPPIPPLVGTETNLPKTISKIKIAKLLCENQYLEEFKTLPPETQLQYINQFYEILNKKQDNIVQHINLLCIKIKLEKFNKFKEKLQIETSSTNEQQGGLLDTITDVLTSEQVQGTLIGGIIGILAYLGIAKNSIFTPIVTTINNIPFLAPAINTLSLAGSTTGLIMSGIFGATLGYKFYSTAKYILKPFTYLYQETIDLINKKNATIQKLFRGSSILAVGLGITAGITYLVIASNPAIGPFITGLILAAAGGFIGASITAKITRVIVEKTNKYFYDIENPEDFKPTQEATACLGANLANQVGEFIKNQIILFNNSINTYKNDIAYTNYVKSLEDIKVYLNNTWNKIQVGSYAPINLDAAIRSLFQREWTQIENLALGQSIINNNDLQKLLAEINANQILQKSSEVTTLPLNQTTKPLIVFTAYNTLETSLKALEELKEFKTSLENINTRSLTNPPQ